MVNKGPCQYGAITREMCSEIKDDIKEIKISIKEVNTNQTELFNHQSNRWPQSATWALTTLGTLLGAVITAGVMKWLI